MRMAHQLLRSTAPVSDTLFLPSSTPRDGFRLLSLYFKQSVIIGGVLHSCRECARLMVTFHQRAGSGKLTGVHRKYSTSKFGHAARTEPANFLLNFLL